MQTNSRDKVIRALAMNPDGEIILNNMKLNHLKLDLAVETIINSMAENGYLTAEKNVVLLSVDGKNPEKVDTLRSQLAQEINTNLVNLIGGGKVLDQAIQTSDDLKKLADEYGITPGKAALVQKLIAENPNLKYADLAVLSMQDLLQKLKTDGVNIEDYIDFIDDTLDDDALEDELDDLLDDLDDLNDLDDLDDPDNDLNDNLDDDPDDILDDISDDISDNISDDDTDDGTDAPDDLDDDPDEDTDDQDKAPQTDSNQLPANNSTAIVTDGDDNNSDNTGSGNSTSDDSSSDDSSSDDSSSDDSNSDDGGNSDDNSSSDD
ncbi:MAG: hypothetical protein PHP50_11435 [Lachnospiraceae bacterium]|nr:hypothetical protein [Lachnospiraceae bacterium]